jgi:hypothetical protein
MQIHSNKMENLTIIEKIFQLLTLKLNFVVCSTEKSKNIYELFIDKLQSFLSIHKQKLNQQDNEEHALQVSFNICCSISYKFV